MYVCVYARWVSCRKDLGPTGFKPSPDCAIQVWCNDSDSTLSLTLHTLTFALRITLSLIHI